MRHWMMREAVPMNHMMARLRRIQAVFLDCGHVGVVLPKGSTEVVSLKGPVAAQPGLLDENAEKSQQEAVAVC